MMEDNLELPYEFVKQAIIAKAEKEAGKLEAYDFWLRCTSLEAPIFKKHCKKLHINQKGYG